MRPYQLSQWPSQVPQRLSQLPLRPYRLPLSPTQLLLGPSQLWQRPLLLLPSKALQTHSEAHAVSGKNPHDILRPAMLIEGLQDAIFSSFLYQVVLPGLYNRLHVKFNPDFKRQSLYFFFIPLLFGRRISYAQYRANQALGSFRSI